jgi:hypothetical protein
MEGVSGSLIEVLSKHLQWRLRETMKSLGYLVFRPKFEIRTSRLSVPSFTAMQTRC